jgi:RNA polymerase sigma-70 factor (ECF subfamily)
LVARRALNEVGDISTPELWSQADLEHAFGVVKNAWPGIAVPFEVFVAYLVARIASPAEIRDDWLQDLYLACACANGVPAGLQSFRTQYFATVAQAAKPFDDSPPFAEEIYQRLSDTLFVADGPSRGKIVRYAGRGPLAGFVATAAKRMALRAAAYAKRFQGEAELIDRFSQFTEQETTLMKLRYRETFNRALSIALRQLPSRERLILRMNLVERVSTTRLAALYKVSQPTVSRRIQRSAKAIFATVKDLVCDELDIDTRELESLLLLVRSQIEITISLAGGSSTLMRGPITVDLCDGKTIALHVDGGPPYRLLLLKNGQPSYERPARDRAELEAHDTAVAVAENAAAPYDLVREALARLADALVEVDAPVE